MVLVDNNYFKEIRRNDLEIVMGCCKVRKILFYFLVLGKVMFLRIVKF